MSVYLDWNLFDWTFGFHIDPDWCWFDLTLRAGPLSLSLIYWRVMMQ